MTIVNMALLSIQGVVLLGLLWGYWHLRQQHRLALRRVEASEVLLKAARRQFETVDKNVEELRNGFTGLGNELHQVLDKQEWLTQKLTEVTYIDPEQRLYSRATKLAEMGAGLDELMHECELPKAEAELLLNLRRQIKERRG
ncbi:MAG: DUF2802 domain-containing protein [Plesiomonas sp.]|uniref:DUF2802 domain-containing protein n=1 Tax=Plesiomonas sp. TaxID=2486279 RepID=UPI003F2CCDBC